MAAVPHNRMRHSYMRVQLKLALLQPTILLTEGRATIKQSVHALIVFDIT